MNLIQTKVIKYTDEGGRILDLFIPVSDEHFAVRPVAAALGMYWRDLYKKLAKLGLITELLWHGEPVAAMPLDKCREWLDGINIKRAKFPERLTHFRQHLPTILVPAQTVAETGPEIIKPEPTEQVKQIKQEEEDFWSEAASEAYLRELYTIEVHKELEPADKFRADLVAVGVRDAAEINYICANGLAAFVFKPNPDDPDGEFLKLPVSIRSYIGGTLIQQARRGYLPKPVFFRRHPHLYKQQTVVRHVLKWGEELPNGLRRALPSNEYRREPAGGAPWFTDEFALEISHLLSIHEHADEREEQKRMTEAFLQRGSIWGDSDDTGEFEQAAA